MLRVMMMMMLVLVLGVWTSCALAQAPAPIPVIFDTDIGDDIDDTWALVQLLKSPQFDLKLVATDNGKPEYRAKLMAKLLTVAQRTDVAVALGPGKAGSGGQQPWVADYKLADYQGKVHADGVQAIIDTIHNSPTPITIIAIGPVQTLAAVLEKDPAVAGKAHFVGMHGAVRKGYGGKDKPEAEYNVKVDAAACRKVLAAPWKSATITPLDTCGLVSLSGKHFAALRESKDELVQALLENYRIWAKKERVDQLTASSVLFDTVAVYLADPSPRELVELEALSIAVTVPQGMTVIDPAGAKMNVAARWKNLDGYRELLTRTLLSPTTTKR
jgi:inosine-uridine nucleoside N-ribohydrolase